MWLETVSDSRSGDKSTTHYIADDMFIRDLLTSALEHGNGLKTITVPISVAGLHNTYYARVTMLDSQYKMIKKRGLDIVEQCSLFAELKFDHWWKKQ